MHKLFFSETLQFIIKDFNTFSNVPKIAPVVGRHLLLYTKNLTPNQLIKLVNI